MNKVFCYLVISKTKLSAQKFSNKFQKRRKRERKGEIQIGENKMRDKKGFLEEKVTKFKIRIKN